MNIIIKQEVKDHLRARGRKTMTIYAKVASGCWSPRPEIFVKLKEPEVPENYNKYERDGINLFLYKEAILKEDAIEIQLAKRGSDLANKEFHVEGLEI